MSALGTLIYTSLRTQNDFFSGWLLCQTLFPNIGVGQNILCMYTFSIDSVVDFFVNFIINPVQKFKKRNHIFHSYLESPLCRKLK